MSTDGIFFNAMWDVRITDTSLRDGSHHKRHQFTRRRCRRSSPPSTPRAFRSSR